ncbi:MAG: rhomboid family intramembrane serine protease [Planctomycetaceae bacterium]|nr:rhomboid family intramembrane serine protease [Planctomycetaceae bacterium]
MSRQYVIVTRLLLHLRFTLCVLCMLVASAFVSGTSVGHISAGWLEQYGFAPVHIPLWEWHRLLTSVFLTHGGVTFFVSLGMVAVCVGLAEMQFGTGRTTLLFVLSHVITLMVQSLLLALPLHHLDIRWGTILATEYDVGPSAGYYGCLGAVCRQLPAKRRWVTHSVLTCLTLRLLVTSVLQWEGWKTSISADIAHLIAFFAGLWLAQALGRTLCKRAS